MKKAFTMLELVFVIVVIGILASVMISRTDSTTVHERAIELVSKIRYTQHLAMVDDKYDTGNWYRNRWQIVFNGNQYSIVSANAGFAANTMNDGNTTQNIELRGLNPILLGGGCDGNTTISFDHLGRPMTGDIGANTASYIAGQLLTSICTITLSDGGPISPVIDIEPETGYARIR